MTPITMAIASNQSHSLDAFIIVVITIFIITRFIIGFTNSLMDIIDFVVLFRRRCFLTRTDRGTAWLLENEEIETQKYAIKLFLTKGKYYY